MRPLHHSRPVPEPGSGAGRTRFLHTVGVAALALCLAGPATAWPEGERPTDLVAAPELEGLGEILNILSSSPADTHGRSLALAHLVAKGPHSVPAIHALLAGTAPIPDELLENGPLMTRERKKLLFDAVRSWDSRRVGEELVEILDQDPSRDSRLVAVSILSEVGNSRSIELLFEIVHGFEPVELAHPAMGGLAVESVSRSLKRDALCYVVLAVLLRDFTEEQLFLTVDAIRMAGRVEGVDLLENLLDRTPELDQRVLAALGTLGIRELARAGDRVQHLTRPFLASTDTRTRREAIRTLGALHDTSSFMELTELLEDANAEVADAALEALRAISGTSWPPSPAGWQRWFRRERAWLEERATALSGELEIGDPEAAMKAIRELASHPLFRTEMSRTIGRAVDHESRAVAVLACQSLGHLRCPEALDLLVEALYDPRAAVREAAAQSLRHSTGQELPTDGSAWRRWLEG